MPYLLLVKAIEWNVDIACLKIIYFTNLQLTWNTAYYTDWVPSTKVTNCIK